MKVLILTNGDIEQLMPVETCVDVMARALEALARGDVHQPLRMIVRPPNVPGLMGLMPAVLSGTGRKPVYGVKVVCLFADNSARGKDIHQGSVMLLDGTTGELLSLMNASSITAIRTAAVPASQRGCSHARTQETSPSSARVCRRAPICWPWPPSAGCAVSGWRADTSSGRARWRQRCGLGSLVTLSPWRPPPRPCGAQISWSR